ncbi:MAG: type II secretion system protein GspC [Gammaproteobacteria bacterium]|nr:type II secretion system protein GspC [Gammaproteobacteria bacterium]
MNTLNQNFAAFWQKNAAAITKIIAALLLLLALFILAKLVWLWIGFSQPSEVIIADTPVARTSPKSNVNANKIAQMHLFGEANRAAEPVEEVSGETRLSLKLIGVYVDSNDQLSSAIIRSGGNKEKVYWVGDRIDGVGGSRVELKKVEPLRVIIRNGAKNETLTLLEKLNQQVIASAKKPLAEANASDSKTIDKRRDSRLTQDLADIRDKLSQSPQSYADLARFEMVTDDAGQVSGFKVAPGKDPRMFSRLGLRRNDVVTSVNGEALSNQAYWTVLEQLQTAETLEVNIERNGQPITLLLNLGAQQESNQQDQPRNDTRDLKIQ